MPLLVDKPELTEIRPTKDVDVVAKIVTYQEFSALEERLRSAGFRHDTSKGAPICRWVIEGSLVDIMPLDAKALGMNSKWFPEALELARPADLGRNCTAKIISPALFLATKLEAFKDRGQDDYYGSHDLEDIVTLMDGTARIVHEVRSAPDTVREFICEWFAKFLKDPDFLDAFPGHLSGLTGSRERAPLVLQRFQAIAQRTWD